MKKLILSILLIFLFLGCNRQWNNPISTDEDLKITPKILQINLDSDKNVSIILDYSYSNSSNIVLERKSLGGFEKIKFVKQTQTTLVDTSFEKEVNHTFIYRESVTKDKYRSSYSVCLCHNCLRNPKDQYVDMFQARNTICCITLIDWSEFYLQTKNI